MATLPTAEEITASGATEGDAKAWFSGLRYFINSMLGADGLVATALQKLMAPFNSTAVKTGAYTVVATDRGKVIKCTGTWTLSAQSIVTLGDGFVFFVKNAGAGVITFDPSLAEQIDGALTMTINPGQMVAFYCDGAAFYSFGKGGVESINSRTGIVTLSNADVTGALGFTPSPSGHIHASTVVAISNAIQGIQGWYFIATRSDGSTFQFYRDGTGS